MVGRALHGAVSVGGDISGTGGDDGGGYFRESERKIGERERERARESVYMFVCEVWGCRGVKE
jgi:hypothetical protein